jgi:hypothetical protein
MIDNFDAANVGKYVCKAENSLGSDSKEVFVSMKPDMTVKVVPDQLTLRAGEIGSLECVVDGNIDDYQIRWKDAFESDAEEVSVMIKASSIT